MTVRTAKGSSLDMEILKVTHQPHLMAIFSFSCNGTNIVQLWRQRLDFAVRTCCDFESC